jgi:putative colanic acid biosynthesis acetyltransferase WcaF
LKTDLTIFNNDWYWKNYNSANIVKKLFWVLANRFFINTYFPWPIFLKRNILLLFGANIGKNLTIKPKVNIKFPWLLSIGDNVWLGELVWIDNLAKVNIGKNVCISQNAMLLTGNHDYKTPAFDLKIGEINLDDGVWIGAKAIVCPNVICKSHAMLTAGSVATSELEAYKIYQGNPAVYIRDRL